jgi:hypothetical protein
MAKHALAVILGDACINLAIAKTIESGIRFLMLPSEHIRAYFEGVKLSEFFDVQSAGLFDIGLALSDAFRLGDAIELPPHPCDFLI